MICNLSDPSTKPSKFDQQSQSPSLKPISLIPIKVTLSPSIASCLVNAMNPQLQRPSPQAKSDCLSKMISICFQVYIEPIIFTLSK